MSLITENILDITAPPLPMRPFSVDEYHRLAEVGILTDDDRVELLEGWIVRKMVRGPRHDTAVTKTTQALMRVLPPGWHFRCQSGMTTRDSEPEPDVLVVRDPVEKYSTEHPAAPDIGLVVEVADSSLSRDRTIKLRLYARARIACYWIINLSESKVEVYSHPTVVDGAPVFASVETFEQGQDVPLILDGSNVASIAVSALLPLKA